VISEETGVRKPSAEIFRLAVEQLGVGEHEVLFVGDHPQMDIVGAANAGLQTAWLRRGRTWPTQQATVYPDIVIDSFDKLLWVAARSPR
jgi:putative hydrolase of the HAD superfamily